MTQEVDWVAKALLYRLVLDGIPSRSGKYASVAQWWDTRLSERHIEEWRWVAKNWSMNARAIGRSNVAQAMIKIGLEPTAENYLRLVNAARKLANPAAKEIKLHEKD